MDKKYYLVPVGYFTLTSFVLMTGIVCSFPEPSKTCFCEEIKKVNQDSLPEKPQPFYWGSINIESSMGTASETPSPSMEIPESYVS